LARNACIAVLKVAARAHRHHLPRRLTEIRPLDAPQLSFDAVDSMVMDAVYWFGVRGYEGQVAALWSRLCSHAQAVLEVGGNVGLFTTLGGLACSGRYTVVEPVPAVADVLRSNLARNAVNGVRVLTAAAVPGDLPGEVCLNIPDEHRDAPVGAHLVEGVEVSGRGSHQILRVRGEPFNQLIKGCDLIKIDAEGIEARLLGNARDIILAQRPILMVEVLPESVSLGEVIADLARGAGYSIHIVPEYGDERIVIIPAGEFTSAVPQRHRSKDVVLAIGSLPP
jgi:FkbM family methyltransferase